MLGGFSQVGEWVWWGGSQLERTAVLAHPDLDKSTPLVGDAPRAEGIEEQDTKNEQGQYY